MALRIEYKDDMGNTHSRSWHYSEPLPEEYKRARVLKLTADGDELDLIVDALTRTVPVPPVTIDVTPNWTCPHQHPCYNCKPESELTRKAAQ
jgi:hypothetical protein